MKKAVVTGATGFIGQWLVAELVRNHVEVIALVRPGNPQPITLPHQGLHCVPCDIQKKDDILNALQGLEIDVFYHLAWLGMNQVGDAELQIENILSIMRILDAMAEMNISTFVGAGSFGELEVTAEMHRPRKMDNPYYLYKAAKLAAHAMAKAKADIHGIRFLWPIITNAYGPGEKNQRLVQRTIRMLMNGQSPAFSSGEQIYDFVYVSDAAKAFYLLGEHGIGDERYIIGSGRARKLKLFFSELGEAINPAVSLQFDTLGYAAVDVPAEDFSIQTLVRDTGFQARISFAEGVRKTAQWIQTGAVQEDV